jgi:hypothetical protein
MTNGPSPVPLGRAPFGWVLIVCGWLCYLASLGCPAAHSGWDVLGPSMGNLNGFGCLLMTLAPPNWLAAPLLFFYGLANLLMIGSAFMVRSTPDTRCLTGVFMFLSFLISLSAPWCDREIKVFAGCVLWQASFLAVGLGFMRLANADTKV